MQAKKRKKSKTEKREGGKGEGVREGRHGGRQRGREGKRRIKGFNRAWPAPLAYISLKSFIRWYQISKILVTQIFK